MRNALFRHSNCSTRGSVPCICIVIILKLKQTPSPLPFFFSLSLSLSLSFCSDIILVLFLYVLSLFLACSECEYAKGEMRMHSSRCNAVAWNCMGATCAKAADFSNNFIRSYDFRERREINL